MGSSEQMPVLASSPEVQRWTVPVAASGKGDACKVQKELGVHMYTCITCISVHAEYTCSF